MKMSSRIQGLVYTMLCMLIFLSGWIFYFFTEISREESEAIALNENTALIKDSIKDSLKDPINSSHEDKKTEKEKEYIVSEDFLNYVDLILKENKELKDSLQYYSMFYDMVMENHNITYSFAQKDSANISKYSARMVDSGRKPIKKDTIEISEAPEMFPISDSIK